MILWSQTPDLNGPIGAWASYDGTGKVRHTTGDTTEPPYSSVLDAMKDGWRVIQFPQLYPTYPGMELSTSYLRFEHILEMMEEIE